jgi:hypothetical protein
MGALVLAPGRHMYVFFGQHKRPYSPIYNDDKRMDIVVKVDTPNTITVHYHCLLSVLIGLPVRSVVSMMYPQRYPNGVGSVYMHSLEVGDVAEFKGKSFKKSIHKHGALMSQL